MSQQAKRRKLIKFSDRRVEHHQQEHETNTKTTSSKAARLPIVLLEQLATFGEARDLARTRAVCKGWQLTPALVERLYRLFCARDLPNAELFVVKRARDREYTVGVSDRHYLFARLVVCVRARSRPRARGGAGGLSRRR